MDNYNNNFDNNAEHCVCCGDIIPEGKHLCSKCDQQKPINYNYIEIDINDLILK